MPDTSPAVMERAPAGQERNVETLRILAFPGTEETLPTRVRQDVETAAALGFIYPATLRGSTPHFNVYYDAHSLPAAGPVIADAVLQTCERDYSTMSAWFGGLTPRGMPFNVIITALDPTGQGRGGAFHFGCGAVDLYLDAKTAPTLDPDYTRFLLVAEAVEVFSDSQGRGWDCSASNGEGLSRVLATDLYPWELDGYTSAAVWLDSGRPDFVNVTDPTDRNYVSIGCSVLFLNYLRHQLDFTWQEIVAAAAPTLEGTYNTLTRQANGLTPFRALLDAFFPPGRPSNLRTDDPFPLLYPMAPFCGVQFRGTVPARATYQWFTWGWPVHWCVLWNVVPTNVDLSGPQLTWSVATQKTSGTALTYWISITNTGAAPVDVEARYSVLCQL